MFSPVNIFVLFAEVFVEVSVQYRIGERVAQPEKVQDGVHDGLVARDDGLHQACMSVTIKLSFGCNRLHC